MTCGMPKVSAGFKQVELRGNLYLSSEAGAFFSCLRFLTFHPFLHCGLPGFLLNILARDRVLDVLLQLYNGRDGNRRKESLFTGEMRGLNSQLTKQK